MNEQGWIKSKAKQVFTSLNLLAPAYKLGKKLRIVKPASPGELDIAINDFIEVNKKYWNSKKYKETGILVEGHLSDYGINYLFRTGVAALAVQDKLGLDVEVVFSGTSRKWLKTKRTYESFGIKRFLYLKDLYRDAEVNLKKSAAIFTDHYRGKLKTPDDILKIKFDGLLVGDLIYDDILKTNMWRTIEAIDEHVFEGLEKSYFFYLQYQDLFKSKNYKYYISTHSAYSEYGLLCRVALMNEVKVIETTDIQTNYYDRINDLELPTYHQGIKNIVHRLMRHRDSNIAKAVEEAKQSLNERMNSKVQQIDVQRAYRGTEYSKDQLEQSLDLDPGKNIVFILAHIFCDSPHTSSFMIYSDYYVWLEKTLEVCCNIKSVNWVIKPHPASSLYGEEGVVEEMIRKLNSRNVKLCPDDFNTKSIRNCANGIATVHGTAGLEFSCLGIPVVLAGKPFYSGLGFTSDPDNVKDYESALKSFENANRLSEEQVNTAYRVLSIWNTQFEWTNPIITMEVLANVWGSEIERNPVMAIRILTENLKANNPRELRLWIASQEYVK
jgi:hypothetical protein